LPILGKTFIAVMMIKEKMAEVLNGNKKTVFLVHRVPLVTQQAKFIAENTPLRVRSFCGADNIDFWKEQKWKKELDKHDVLVMVHDVFKLALNHGYFSMEKVNLLIVDECHHSMGNSSYNQIFTHHYHPMKNHPDLKAPHVLALTASIVTTQVKTIGMYQYAQSAHATICSVLTQPLATL
jgi:endoribonuclease Dicer